MKTLVDGLYLVAKRKDGRVVVLLTSIFFFLLLLVSQNGKTTLEVFSFGALPFAKRSLMALSAFFDFRSTFTTGSLILAVLGSLLGGINLSLAYLYIKMRGQIIFKSGLYSGIGLFFAFLGIGCAACGTAFLSVILGLLGFTTMLQILPFGGEEIGYLGLLVLCFATYTLAHKVMSPNVC